MMDKTNFGKYIVIEGLDGAGTTTQVKMLSQYLFDKSKANDFVLTREPTMHCEKGREIRRRLTGNLLEHEKVNDDFGYWAALFVGNRKSHLENRVIPALKSGFHVISDRHMLSTLAYQSMQGGHISDLIQMHEGFYQPDLTIFVRVPAEIALNRIRQNRNTGLEYFESNLPRIAENYEKAISILKGKREVVVVDGTKSIDEVFSEIKTHVDKLFGYK
jgi:dTMP kinase